MKCSIDSANLYRSCHMPKDVFVVAPQQLPVYVQILRGMQGKAA